MEQLNILDMKILHVLQNYPLEPFSSLAEKLSVSPQTMIRRVNSLKERGILRNAIASFEPERISLNRYGVMFDISALHQFTLLQNAISEHNYIRAYNRFYGERFGIYAHFDLPPNSDAGFKKFLDYLVEQEYCDDYKIMKSLGYRGVNPQQLPKYTSEPETFDVITFWEKRITKSTSLPRLPSSIDFKMIEPLHFLLLRDLTRSVKNGRMIDIRTKQTDLIEHYNDYYLHLSKKDKLTETESAYLFNLSEFFDTKNGHNAKVEFGRKYYNLVVNNLITNPRWNFSRKLFEQHVTRAYFIENIPEPEKAQIFRFFNEEKLPFQMAYELFNKGIFLRITLPPYYDSKINYLIWSTFKDYNIYSLDFFGKHGMWWPFYIDNFDWSTKSWKTSDDWMFNDVVKVINDNLQNGNYGDFNMDKRYSKNGEYLRKHIANGNGAIA